MGHHLNRLTGATLHLLLIRFKCLSGSHLTCYSLNCFYWYVLCFFIVDLLWGLVSFCAFLFIVFLINSLDTQFKKKKKKIFGCSHFFPNLYDEHGEIIKSISIIWGTLKHVNDQNTYIYVYERTQSLILTLIFWISN